jgi:hypothetical protein
VPVDRHISNSGQCRGGICAGFGFRSFRRIRLKRISTFRTLAARSPHALMLSGGMKFVCRTHLASLFSSPLPRLVALALLPISGV